MKVSLDQIKDLEERIAHLNQQISEMMQKSTAEDQDSIFDPNYFAELRESALVLSDETLGWDISQVNNLKEMSQLVFTPINFDKSVINNEQGVGVFGNGESKIIGH